VRRRCPRGGRGYSTSSRGRGSRRRRRGSAGT